VLGGTGFLGQRVVTHLLDQGFWVRAVARHPERAPPLFGPTRQDPGAWPNSFRKARFLSAVGHLQLDSLRRRVMQVMGTIFRQVDVILAPAITGKMTLIGNMTGQPCLTIRAGFTQQRAREMPAYLDAEIKEKDGPARKVPYGITIVAPLFDEAAALTLGRALEKALGVADRRPKHCLRRPTS
jgi:Asp-tRNA(Asn)/Glu-tRNA(Gln) amidotransferase A subunit family amidase